MRWKTITAAACAVLSASGCGLLKPTKDRLDYIEHASACGRPAKTLIVFLPGRFDAPQDIIDNGFARALDERRIDADLVIPDLHFGYYRERTVVDRLQADIVGPRRGAYDSIWLAGISLGGFGALLQTKHQGAPDGMLLVAPYLGGRGIHEEIRGAGGLRQWDPQASLAADHEIELWQWLRDRAPYERMVIGYGREDDFAPANRTLASLLPEGREIPVAGGHDWRPWLTVWDRFLAMRMLPVCAGEPKEKD